MTMMAIYDKYMTCYLTKQTDSRQKNN